ncbi:glycosyltransferase [Asticcacaulis sp. BYS171W]|uniref:Glycosyltransferase n=1 Tax=Asticcacaulis aquaticus TaxID=2984212 RepID=A0ABT5HS98_9CAUL|nr:glycosyltransferase [Asticcacaulis aquaticus]MDC7682869.1 glycosyltransferase [Asticcacaulis aquaticus]
MTMSDEDSVTEPVDNKVTDPHSLLAAAGFTACGLLWFAKDILSYGPKSAFLQYRSYIDIARSGRFDPAFYNAQLGDNRFGPARLLRHYILHGHREGLDPAADFSTQKYLDFYPDIRHSGSNPLSHYIRYGEREYRIALPSSLAVNGADPNTISLEERHANDWPVAKNPKLNRASLGRFDVRPDDDVPVEGLRGEQFLSRFRLTEATPDFAGAIAELQRMRGSSALSQAGTIVDVSIVIPVFGQLGYTLNCLHSLLSLTTRYRFEIIIGDDRSLDATERWLPKLEFLTYIRHDENAGFIANCNRAAKAAQGRFLVLLNNDIRVVDGWLDQLLDTFARFPKAGLVGSKLFYPDGKLQEAGGIVWQDASAWNYGRDDDPNRPRYSYARQIDYVSGCSIALPTDLWQEMEGFDPHFSPAYYEDVDLCFRLRKAGYQTWLQPRSRVIHYEGKTSGTDTTQGAKAYQIANTSKFLKRWQPVLASHRPNGQEPWLERERHIRRRVLIVDAVNPTPWQDAGSLAIINLFRYYQALDYQVTFVPVNFLYEARAVSEMQAMGVQALYAPFEQSLASVLKKYSDLLDVVHVIRPEEAEKCFELIRTLTPRAQAIYQNCDLHYLRMERQAEVEQRPDLFEAARTMKARELRLSREYDLTITHSEAEKQILDHELADENILVMPLIENVVEVNSPFNKRRDVMFLGGYSHPPNVDAAQWILDEIWPPIAERFPQARLLLVGANPTESIKSRASDRIIVTGMVDDLAPWFARTRLFLAALRYGAGAKGKVLASLAHGVPVVATDIAAEGLPLENGKSVFLANDAPQIVTEALRLYTQKPTAWQKHSKAAQAYITRHHSFATGVELLTEGLKLSRAKQARLPNV